MKAVTLLKVFFRRVPSKYEREQQHKIEALERGLLGLQMQLDAATGRIAELEKRPVMLQNPWDYAAQFKRIDPLPPVPTRKYSHRS